MAKKGRIDSIIDIQKVDKEIKTIVSDLDMLVGRLEGVIKKSEEVNLDFKGAKSLAHLNDTYKKFNSTQQEAVVILDDITKKEKERQKAQEALEKQRARGLAQMAKEEAKERELRDALKLTVKTEEDAIRQNKALREIRKRTDSTTQEGIKTIQDLNSKIDSNTEFLKKNADAYTQQKMNVGSYKDSIIDAAKETEIFGLSVNKVSSFLSSGAGIVTAITATVVGLGKAYASSARGAEDMARASDRLNAIAKSLGNTIADATGETNLFDTIIRGFQQQFLGLASTMESDVQVAIMSVIRQLEVLEIDQERQKKARLDEAEVLRQIRDEERNSLEERKKANDELGRVINEREKETIAFQEKKLKNYQALLQFDEGNIDIQKAIKQIEFEIADAREEAQGYRSEQLVNDLALSREYYTNQIELGNLAIESEINKNGVSLDLTKKLLENKLNLELEAAGRNEQLRDIAYQKYQIELQKAEDDYKKHLEADLEADKKQSEAKEKQRLEDLEKQRAAYELQARFVSNGVLQAGEQEFKALSDQLANKEITLEQYNKRVLDLQKDLSREQDEIMLESLLQQARIIEAAGGDVIGIEKAIFDLKKKMREEDSDDIVDKAEKDIEIEKQFQERKKELYQEGYDTIKSLAGSYFDSKQIKLEEEAQKDEEAKQRELEAAQGNQSKIDEINARYEEKEKKRQNEQRALKTKQAQADKLFAMFEVAIETAKGVSKSVAASPLTFGLPWSAFVAATGALQLAAIAAQPIPKYRKGRQGGPEELAIVGDGGRELIEHQGRHYLTPDTDTLALLPRGANVIPNDETVALLNQMDNHNAIPVFDTSRLEEKIESNFKQLAEVVKNKKEIHLNITEEGMYLAVRNGTNFTKYVNRKILN